MPRKKILWLCSWYPNDLDPFNGDFIQRHAQAASLLNEITVIYVQPASENRVQTNNPPAYPNLTEQIIYVHRSLTGFIGKLGTHLRWTSAFRHAIRNYISLNGLPDLVHVHVPMKAGMVALWMLRVYNIPFLVTEHWGIYNDVVESNYPSKNFLFKYLTRRIFSKASAFLPVSRFIGDAVNKEVASVKFEVIPNVVNTSIFFPKVKNQNCFIFLHVSNMVPLKNAAGILDAFELFLASGGEAELVMVGDKDPSIRQYADTLKHAREKTSFKGEVPIEVVAQEMQGANAFILFSNIENSPCVIGEALCSGLPVIASNVGGVPELINPSNSILVTPKNTGELAAAMQTVMTNYTGYDRAGISRLASDRFGYMVVSRKLDEAYTKVLKTVNS